MSVVETLGHHALGVSSVSRSLGVRPSSLYHHMNGNEAIQHAVAMEGWKRLLEALPEPSDERGEAIRRFGRAYRRFALENPNLYRVMSETPLDAEDPALLAVLSGAIQTLSVLGLSGAERLHALRGLRAAVHGFVHLEVCEQVRMDLDPDESFDWIVEVVVSGIVASREEGEARTAQRPVALEPEAV